MEEAKAAVDMTPWVSVIGSIVGWFFFVIVLGMLKGFLTGAMNMYVAEVIWKLNDDEKREKIVKWMTNSEKVLEYLKQLEKKEG